jgi:hypothetical protein
MISVMRVAQEPVMSWGTYHVAYTMVAVIYLAYAASLWRRARKYRRAIARATLPPRG